MKVRQLGVVLTALAALVLSASGVSAQTYPGNSSAGTRVGPIDPNPTYGPNAPPGSWQHVRPRTEVRSWNTDPVLAERPNAPGKYYDARTGSNRETGTLGAGTQADTRERTGDERNGRANGNGYYDSPNNINIAKWAANTNERGEPENAAISFIDGVGGFNDGRKDLLGSGNNRLSLDVLRAEGNIEAQAGLVNGGVQANVNAHGQVTLVGLNWENRGTFNEGGPVEVTLGHQGQAYIGAEAGVQGTATITRERVVLNGRAGAFAGGRVSETVTAGVGNPNVGSASVQATGELSYGIGATAEGYFTIDWTNMSVKYGARANVTLGVGAGVGIQGEISIAPLVRNTVGFVRNTAIPALASAANTIGSGIASGARSVGSWVSSWFSSPAPPPPAAPMPVASNSGSNVPRTAITGPRALGGPASGGSSSSSPGGAGLETGR